jgi:hypothetical protein
MKQLFLLLFGIPVFSASYAQTTKGYEEGFVVTNAGDTVRGEIKHKSGDEIKDRIYVRVTEEDKRNYKTTDIQYFQAGDESYITQEIDGEKVFLLEWSVGYLELYEEQIPGSSEGSSSYQAYIRKAGEKELVAIKPGSWKKQILSYISDDTQLAGEVEKNKYKLEELGTIIRLYNEGKE